MARRKKRLGATMDQKTKDKLNKLSAEADTITDGILFKASQSAYTWAFLAASHAAAFVLGAYFF